MVGARGTRATHSVAYGVRAKRACRAPKPTHYTDAETEAWSRPVAKGQKSKLISPGLQSSQKHVRTALQCLTLCRPPRWGKEKGWCGPAKRSVGAAAREPGRRMAKRTQVISVVNTLGGLAPPQGQCGHPPCWRARPTPGTVWAPAMLPFCFTLTTVQGAAVSSPVFRGV